MLRAVVDSFVSQMEIIHFGCVFGAPFTNVLPVFFGGPPSFGLPLSLKAVHRLCCCWSKSQTGVVIPKRARVYRAPSIFLNTSGKKYKTQQQQRNTTAIAIQWLLLWMCRACVSFSLYMTIWYTLAAAWLKRLLHTFADAKVCISCSLNVEYVRWCNTTQVCV